MKVIPEVESYDLSNAYLYPIWLRIECYGRVIWRQCHFYLVSTENNVDLYRAVSGENKMTRFACFNNVQSVDEVDGPPEPEAAPTTAETLIAAAPATEQSDYDL